MVDCPSLSDQLPVAGVINPSEKEPASGKETASEKAFALEKELVFTVLTASLSEVPATGVVHSSAIEPLVCLLREL